MISSIFFGALVVIFGLVIIALHIVRVKRIAERERNTDESTDANEQPPDDLMFARDLTPIVSMVSMYSTTTSTDLP